MPTFDVSESFRRDLDKLSDADRASFQRAIAHFVDDLRRNQFRKGLRVKKVAGNTDAWEMTWAPDGRATFEYGDNVKSGEVHVVWRRIGGHEIFKRP